MNHIKHFKHEEPQCHLIMTKQVCLQNYFFTSWNGGKSLIKSEITLKLIIWIITNVLYSQLTWGNDEDDYWLWILRYVIRWYRTHDTANHHLWNRRSRAWRRRNIDTWMLESDKIKSSQYPWKIFYISHSHRYECQNRTQQ